VVVVTWGGPMRLPISLFLAAASSSLLGCATFEKCGFEGCPGDRQITAQVEDVLRKYPELQGVNQVRVQTINHIVYLYGQVDTEVELVTAQQAAQSVKGVDRVVNSIAFQYQGR
jgi:osmotically-inducible protein OsmY